MPEFLSRLACGRPSRARAGKDTGQTVAALVALGGSLGYFVVTF